MMTSGSAACTGFGWLDQVGTGWNVACVDTDNEIRCAHVRTLFSFTGGVCFLYRIVELAECGEDCGEVGRRV